MKLTRDVITAVLIEGGTGCVKMTCDVIISVLFQGELAV